MVNDDTDWAGYNSTPQVIVTRADLASLPVFIDGSDGSLWKSRNTLDEAASDEGASQRHYVRLSDLLKLFVPVGESPIVPPVLPADICPCVERPYGLS